MRLQALLLGFAVLLSAGQPVAAQGSDGSANRAAIERLAFMVGRWRGDAWMLRGSERVQTAMTETVEAKLGGTVLQVEGQGIVSGPVGTEPRVVHHALAVISFDAQTAAYGLRSYLANGHSGDFLLTLVPGGVSWSRETPGGRIRNTAQISNGEWREIGEFSRDGTTWTQIMEMHLRRQP